MDVSTTFTTLMIFPLFHEVSTFKYSKKYIHKVFVSTVPDRVNDQVLP